jgi:hypothetical protein
MKRWLFGAATAAMLTVVPAAFAQVQGRQLFGNSTGSNPTPAGYQIIGFNRIGYSQTTDPGIPVFNHTTTTASTPPVAGGTNNFITQIPGSVFRGPIFVPTKFSFR